MLIHEQQPSYWMTTSALPDFEPLKSNLRVQVGIVGGGISGLTTAYELTRRGFSVIVLDDGLIGGGETSRTTAHLSNALDDRYYILEQYLGNDNARIAAESHSAAITFIEKVCVQNEIACGFERLDAYLFNPPGEGSDNLEKELQAAQRAGIQGVSLVERAPLTSFDSGPCVKFPNQAQFMPLMYMEGLARCIVAQVGQVATRTHVESMEEHAQGCRLMTDSGFVVEAENLVIATNSPINNPFFPHLKQASYRTYVIAGHIPRGSVLKALYYDTKDPYHYIRIVENQDADLLIVGGEDHRVGISKNALEIYGILESWTRERFPQFGPVTQRWSGQIVEPIDGVAFIGRSKPGSRIFIVTGDSGNGLTHGTIAGLLIPDLIMGVSNPWEKLYDPSRKSVAAFRPFMEENAETLAQYRDWVTQADVVSVDEIPPNSGAILRKGLKKIAAYKDDLGRVHLLSAICPHLKGLVRWNAVEKTWDCPCHGSRFKCTGEVINGPANASLTTIDKQET